MTTTLTTTQQLARWAAAQTRATLPTDTLELAKDCLLDHVAVSLHGMTQPWTRFVADQVREEAGKPEARVYGANLRVPARAAALVNGSAAHAFELDDWHAGSLSHLGACVIPAVLAAAERGKFSGERVLVAIVVGFEVMARVGKTSIPSLIIRGYHPTGTHGPIGAAAAVGNLLGVTPEHMTAAFGIAASCAAGLMEFSQDPLGTMVKRFHAGRGAEAGVLAVDLALKGMTAPKSALDGKYGYCQVLSDEPRPEQLTANLDADYEIRHINVKPYACCGALHAPIDAVEQLMREHKFGAADVEDIVFGGNDSHIQRHSSQKPNSVMAAQYSVPYSIAVALTGRALDPRMFDEGSYEQPELLALAARVSVELHPEVVRVYPNILGGFVRVRLKDGRVLERLVLEAAGTTGQPMGREGILRKATALCEPLLDAAKMNELFALVTSLDALDDISKLTRAMDDGVAMKKPAAQSATRPAYA
jgi:2-methylcitrate dehydratase PrpD